MYFRISALKTQVFDHNRMKERKLGNLEKKLIQINQPGRMSEKAAIAITKVGIERREKLMKNIADRLSENSRNSFVDLQSQKIVEKTDRKKIVFSLKTDMLYFD